MVRNLFSCSGFIYLHRCENEAKDVLFTYYVLK